MKTEDLQSIKDGIAYATAKKQYYESLIAKYQALCSHSDIEGYQYESDLGSVGLDYDNDYYIRWDCCVCGYFRNVGSGNDPQEYARLLSLESIVSE